MLLLLCLPGCGGKERKAEEPPKAYSSVEMSRKYHSTFEDGTRSYPDLDYPDYLGGTYTDSVGNLVFLIKGDTVAAKSDILRRIGHNALNLRFEPCIYSLRALSDLVDELGEHFENAELREELGWTFISIAVMENRVYVSFSDCSDNIIAKFKERVSDSPMIRFDKMVFELL